MAFYWKVENKVEKIMYTTMVEPIWILQQCHKESL